MKRVVVLALLLAGCAPAPQAKNDAAYRAYSGKSVEEVFNRWGAPSQELRTADGPLFVWNVPGQGGTFCKLEAQADSTGKVVAFRSSGASDLCALWFDRLR